MKLSFCSLSEERRIGKGREMIPSSLQTDTIEPLTKTATLLPYTLTLGGYHCLFSHSKVGATLVRVTL